MTADQAAQLIAQQQQLLEVYAQIQPLIVNIVHDVFPFTAVLSAALVGGLLAWSAT